MTTIYQFKPQFQAALRPLAARLHRAGVTANMVTIAAMLASMAYGAWMAAATSSPWPFMLLPVFMLGRMALNAIDGMMAREYGQQSRLGALLNETGDVVSDAALYSPFALLPGIRPELVMAVVFLATLTEFVGVLGQTIGSGRRYEGPMGKSDRAFVFGALGLYLGAGGQPSPSLVAAGMFLLIALLAWTVVNRARQALDTN